MVQSMMESRGAKGNANADWTNETDGGEGRACTARV
jgi:hypothetical protein